MKLLLVDDEELLRQVLKSVLESQGFEVAVALNGREALAIVGLEDFKAVITDIKMPEMDGLELLKQIRSIRPTLPVILMTGFSEILETKDAFALGANAFLAKPFKKEDLVSALNSCGLVSGKGHSNTKIQEKQNGNVAAADKVTATDKISETEKDTETFCRVSIDQFISGKDINFPIFIRLNETNHIKIAHKGEDLKSDRIKTLKAKGVEYFYLRTSDFAKYVGFNLTLTRAAKNSRSIPQEKKIALAKHANAVILENIFMNGVNPYNFNQAREVTETTLALLSECPNSFDILEALKASGDPLYTHSIGVSLYSTMIAKEVGWTSPSTMFKVSTAGMFHDIGMKEIGREILEKPRSALTVDEIKRLETHSERSVEILGTIPSISSEIIQAILQHHETCDGRGYPSKLYKIKIIPLASLIAVADEFCEIALPSYNSPGLSAQDAFDRLSMVNSKTLDSKYLSALKTVLGLEKAGA